MAGGKIHTVKNERQFALLLGDHRRCWAWCR